MKTCPFKQGRCRRSDVVKKAILANALSVAPLFFVLLALYAYGAKSRYHPPLERGAAPHILGMVYALGSVVIACLLDRLPKFVARPAKRQVVEATEGVEESRTYQRGAWAESEG